MFKPPLFFKCPVQSQAYGSWYRIICFFVCWRLFLKQFSVTVISLCSSYSWCISLGFGLWPGFVSVTSKSIDDYWIAVNYSCLYLISSSWAVTHYHENRESKCKLWNIVSTWRYILHKKIPRNRVTIGQVFK